MSTKRSLTFNYSLIQSFFWMQFAVLLGFSSIFLLDRGFSNAQIGLLLAVSGTLSTVLQPVIAGYADRPNSISLKKMIALLSVLMLVFAAALFFPGHSILLTGLLYGGCITLLHLITPLVNSLGMQSINQGFPLSFGTARGFGSAAYALASYALGIAVDHIGARYIPMFIFLIFTGFLAVLYFFPFQKQAAPQKSQTAAAENPLVFFRKYKRFSIVLIGFILVYVSHILLSNFTFQIASVKGGGSSETGIVMALAAVCELPVLFGFGFLLKKARCDIWFRISGIGFLMRTVGSLLAPSIPFLYLAQVFQMFGWGLICVSSVYYVNSIMNEQDAVKGQAYVNMTNTFGSVIGALIGGALIDRTGVHTMLTFAVVPAFFGMLILLFVTEKSSTAEHR